MSRAQGIIERIEQEFEDWKKRTIEENTPEAIFGLAYEINTKSVAKDYIINAIEAGQSNLAIYERMDAILDGYYAFHLGSYDGLINEETVEEFEEYMLGELKNQAKEKQAAQIKEERMEYAYGELSEEAQKLAYEEALSYIENEYEHSEDQDIIHNKEAHARDEAENCAVYYEDGSMARLI